MGCAGKKPHSPPAYAAPARTPVAAPAVVPVQAKLIVTPANGLVGKVAKVNLNSRFVVVSFNGGQLPALGRVMPVYRRGLKVGELKMSGPQLDDNLVGDLVAGEAELGDEVREN